MSARVRLVALVSALLLLLGIAVPAQSSVGVQGGGSVAVDELDLDPLPALLDEIVDPGATAPGTTVAADPPLDGGDAADAAPVFPEPDVAELPVTDEPPPLGDGDGQDARRGALEGACVSDVPFPLAVWLPPDGGRTAQDLNAVGAV